MGNAAEQVGSAGRIRIRKIEVEGLCGRFHHSIELNEAERVSILFGPNGVGKTAILRLVDAFFSLNAYAMERVPFSALRVVLAAGNQDQERVWEVVPIGILGVEGSSYQVRFVVDGESCRELLWMPDPEQGGDELGDWFGHDGGPSTHFIATTRLREAIEKKVLTLLVEDSEKKLQIFQELEARIRLFLDFVNRKFRHKKIVIDPKEGFFAIDPAGMRLELAALSSGEQHELVLLYDLLFRVEPDTLVLIDEPEISLHLAWQREFLPELLEIVKVARFDALIATQSPFIVGDRSDLMIPLSDEI